MLKVTETKWGKPSASLEMARADVRGSNLCRPTNCCETRPETPTPFDVTAELFVIRTLVRNATTMGGMLIRAENTVKS